MVRFRLSLTIISLTAVAFITSGCNQPRFSGLNDTQLIFSTSNRSSETAREESYAIAKRFLEDCPTFAFDGIEDTLDIAQVMQREYPPGWLFRFEFNSQHTGYGDRRYESLIPEITRHEAVITVEEERVTKAVMDRSWDMILHMKITTEEESRILGEKFVKESPTFVFDGIESTLKLTDTLYPMVPFEARKQFIYSMEGLFPYCWGFIYEFESQHAGYGDRSGVILTKEITPHELIVVVDQGRIVNAVMDGHWNVIEQEPWEISEVRSDRGKAY